MIQKAQPTRLYLIADGPRPNHPEDVTKTKSARKVVEKIKWKCEVTRIYSAENMGCGQRLPSGLNVAFEREEQLVILEDDCLPDISFFRYCDELLERYKDEERVMMVSGRNGLKKWKEGKQSYHFSRFTPIWGWATWKRAWRYFDPEMKAWGDSNLREQIRVAMGNDNEYNYREDNYTKVYQKRIKTVWSYQWEATLLINNGLSVVSAVNLIENIGFGPDSTHTGLVVFENYLMKAQSLEFPIKFQDKIEPDEEFDKKNSITIPPPPLPRKPIWVLKLYLILPQAIRPLFYRQYLRIYSLCRKVGKIIFTPVEKQPDDI